VGLVFWIDGHDQGRIEEQANIGAEPGAAKIARTKHATVGTRIVRPSANGCQCQQQELEQDPMRKTPQLTDPHPTRVRRGPETRAAPCISRSSPQGLRDFSPGAKAISAMRPPFKATHEFFVIGYFSV
jgi:hypothetical protein